MPHTHEILERLSLQTRDFISELYIFCKQKKQMMDLSKLMLSVVPMKHIDNILITDVLRGILALPVLPFMILFLGCCMLFRGIMNKSASQDIRMQFLLFFVLFSLFGSGIYILMFGWFVGISFILWGLFALYYLIPFRLAVVKEWILYYLSGLEYCHKQLFYFFCMPNPELIDMTKHVNLINKAFESVKNIDRVMYIFHDILRYNTQNANTNLTGVRVYSQGKLEKSTEEITQDQLASHLHQEYSYLYEQLMRVNTLLQEAMQTYIQSLQQSQSLISQTLSNHEDTLIQVAQLQNQRLERQIEQFRLNSEKLLQMSNPKISTQ